MWELGCRSSGRAFVGTKRGCRVYYYDVQGPGWSCSSGDLFNSSEYKKLYRRLLRILTRTKRRRRPGPSFLGLGLVFFIDHCHCSWHCSVYVILLLRTLWFHNHFDCLRLSFPAPPYHNWVNSYASRSSLRSNLMQTCPWHQSISITWNTLRISSCPRVFYHFYSEPSKSVFSKYKSRLHSAIKRLVMGPT